MTHSDDNTSPTASIVSDVDLRTALHAEMRDILRWAREIDALPRHRDARLTLIGDIVTLRDQIKNFDAWHFSLPGGSVSISIQDGEWEIFPQPEPHTITRTLTLLFGALHQLHAWRHNVPPFDGDDDYISRFLARIAAGEIDMRWPDTDRDDYVPALLAIGQARALD